jgi:hypothetical protein
LFGAIIVLVVGVWSGPTSKVTFSSLPLNRGFERPDAVVAGKAGREFGDGAEADLVMVEAGQHRRTGRRTDAGGVERVVTKAFARELVEIGCRDWPAKSAGMAKADIVEQLTTTLGAPLGACNGCGKSATESLLVVPIFPLNGGVGCGKALSA